MRSEALAGRHREGASDVPHCTTPNPPSARQRRGRAEASPYALLQPLVHTPDDSLAIDKSQNLAIMSTE